MGRLGADVDQMDALASYFDRAATTLDGHAATVDGQIRAIWWRGSIADMFTAAWASADRKRITTTADGLREIARKVRDNAAQQRVASGDFAGLVAPIVAQIIDGARAAMETLLGIDSRTPEEIIEWWDGLSEEQKREVVANDPGFGNREYLPLEIRFEANHLSVQATVDELNSAADALEAELLQRLESGDLSATDAVAIKMQEQITAYRRAADTGVKLLYVHDQDGHITPGINQILYADLANGEVAIVTGSLEGADEVLITTPGTGTDIDKYASNFLPEAQILAQGDRAVISTFLWDPPPGLADNLSIGDYTPSIVEGGMDNVVRTAAEHSETIISVSHSAGTDAMTYYAEHSEAADLIDGYVMLGAPNPEAAPAAIDDKPIAFGYHDGDEILYTDLAQPDGMFDFRDNYHDAEAISEEHSNVDAEIKESGVTEGGFGKHHRNSAYYENFGDMIDDMVYDILRQQPGAADLSMDNYA